MGSVQVSDPYTISIFNNSGWVVGLLSGSSIRDFAFPTSETISGVGVRVLNHGYSPVFTIGIEGGSSGNSITINVLVSTSSIIRSYSIGLAGIT